MGGQQLFRVAILTGAEALLQFGTGVSEHAPRIVSGSGVGRHRYYSREPNSSSRRPARARAFECELLNVPDENERDKGLSRKTRGSQRAGSVSDGSRLSPSLTLPARCRSRGNVALLGSLLLEALLQCLEACGVFLVLEGGHRLLVHASPPQR